MAKNRFFNKFGPDWQPQTTKRGKEYLFSGKFSQLVWLKMQKFNFQGGKLPFNDKNLIEKGKNTI